jgi:hypothetical protein
VDRLSTTPIGTLLTRDLDLNPESPHSGLDSAPGKSQYEGPQGQGAYGVDVL